MSERQVDAGGPRRSPTGGCRGSASWRDTLTRVGSYHETFRRGAFAGARPEDVPLLATHAHDELPIGRAVEFTDTETDLHAALRVSETRAGDDVLALVRDGAATGLSVGFIPVFIPVEDVWDARRTKVERAGPASWRCPSSPSPCTTTLHHGRAHRHRGPGSPGTR